MAFAFCYGILYYYTVNLVIAEIVISVFKSRLTVSFLCLFTRRVYIAYLDSVYFFQPKHFRTAVYHEILIGYMDYVKSLG